MESPAIAPVKLAAMLKATVLACFVAVGLAGCAPASAAAVTVDISIRFSRFSPAEVTVPRGRPVAIVLRNDDPIDHEWIVGTDDVHARHRTGTEPAHATRPTEVSIPALESRTTTVTLPHAGTFAFVCHLPGHEAYGMVGTLRVS